MFLPVRRYKAVLSYALAAYLLACGAAAHADKLPPWREARVASAEDSRTTEAAQPASTEPKAGSVTSLTWERFLNLATVLYPALVERGQIAYNQEDYGAAARPLAAAAAMRPDDAALLSQAGFALKQTGAYERALELLFLASVADPGNYQVWWWLGDVQRLVGQYQDSIRSMEMAEDLAPADAAQNLVQYTNYSKGLADTAPSWDNFEIHRDFANRHRDNGRARRFIAEMLTALELAPDTGLEPGEAAARIGWTHSQIGIHYVFIQEPVAALMHFEQALQHYSDTEFAIDVARAHTNMADVFCTLARRRGADRALLLDRALEHREAALVKARGTDNADYNRFALGKLLDLLAERHPEGSPRLSEIREQGKVELPWSGQVTNYGLAAIATGESRTRLNEGDVAGARLALEMTLGYYKESQYLEDAEQAARHFLTLAHIYNTQQHFQSAISQADGAFGELARVRNMIDGDAFQRGPFSRTAHEAAAVRVRAAVAMDDPVLAAEFIEGYFGFRHARQLGSHPGEQTRSADPQAEAELLRRRAASFESAAAQHGGDELLAGLFLRQRETDARRLEWLERHARMPNLVQQGWRPLPMRKGSEILAESPGAAAVVAYIFGAQGGAAVVLQGGSANAVLLDDATSSVVEALVGEAKDGSGEAWVRLQELLFAPVRAWAPAPRVVIIPDEVLLGLPFAALNDGTMPLGEQYVFSYAASFAHLAHRTQRKVRQETFHAVSASDVPIWPADPAAGAAPFASARFSLGGETSEEAVFEPTDVLQVECPIEVQADFPSESALVLEPSSGRDGKLYLLEWCASTMRARLAVCAFSGEWPPARGTEEVLESLTTALSHADIPAALINTARPSAEAAAFVLDRFYTALSELPPAEALALAQRDARAQWPDPGEWAAFQCYGGAPAGE